MSKSKYLYIKKWLIKPKPYPALLIYLINYTLQVKLIVGRVVAVVGCNDFAFSISEVIIKLKAVFRSRFNLFFFINLILVKHSDFVTDCISKIHIKNVSTITSMIRYFITW